MKSFLKQIITFSLLSLVLLLFIGVISKYDNKDKVWSSNSNIISLQSKSKYDSLDVLFVGNSYCYSSIDPKLLDQAGFKTYNLGIATAGVEFYDLVLDDYLQGVTKKPKQVFLLISPMTFSVRSDDFEAYSIHRYLDKPISNVQLAVKLRSGRDLLKMYRKSFKKGLSNLFLDKKNSLNSHKYYKGFVPSSKVFSQDVVKDTKHLYSSFVKEEFDEEKFNVLLSLSNELKKSGVGVTFFEVPTNQLKHYFNKKYLQEYEEQINSLNKKEKVFRVNENLFKEFNYRNIDHMNSSGAVIATNQVIEYLRHSVLVK